MNFINLNFDIIENHLIDSYGKPPKNAPNSAQNLLFAKQVLMLELDMEFALFITTINSHLHNFTHPIRCCNGINWHSECLLYIIENEQQQT